MIWADWFLLAALVMSIIIGILRGFTREFFGLISWVIAIVAAVFLAPATLGLLEPHISTPSLRIAASYAVYRKNGNRHNAIPPRDNISYSIDHGLPTWEPVSQVIHDNGQTLGPFANENDPYPD